MNVCWDGSFEDEIEDIEESKSEKGKKEKSESSISNSKKSPEPKVVVKKLNLDKVKLNSTTVAKSAKPAEEQKDWLAA